MALTEVSKLLAVLTPPLDNVLSQQLVNEFISAERQYILRQWEYAELDGGQFAEILARILYHLDSGVLNPNKSFDECIKYIEEDQNKHLIQPRHNAIHICRVVRTIYKFRSQRGAVHISPNYTANHLDARLIIECVRWGFSETLRLFATGDRDSIGKTVKEILEFDVPCIGKFEDVLLVQRTDLAADEEILVLLHYGGQNGFSRKQLGQYCKFSPASITLSLQKLTSASLREIVVLANGNYRLTDLGEKRLREKLATKLLLQ